MHTCICVHTCNVLADSGHISICSHQKFVSLGTGTKRGALEYQNAAPSFLQMANFTNGKFWPPSF